MSAKEESLRVFGENLRALRKERRLTAGALANLLGISVKTLDAYERCARKPSLSILDDLERELGVEAWRWLIPGGFSEDAQGHLPSTTNEPSLMSLLSRRSERWSGEVTRLSAAIPLEVVSSHLDNLAHQGLWPHMDQGIGDLAEVASENGLTVAEVSLPWNEGHRAAALSTESTEPDHLFVNLNAPNWAQREDMGESLVAHLLGLQPRACKTWADRETSVTKWHVTGRDLFGYSLDPTEWKQLTIDKFAMDPKKKSNACIAKKVVQAMLAESPTAEQEGIRRHSDWPITRIERLYRKDESSFIAGITIRDTHEPEETRLLVSVTDLEVPAIMQRLTRELLVPTRRLEVLLRAGGASIQPLARYACVSEITIQQRLAETGLWTAIYLGQERSRQTREGEVLSTPASKIR